MIETRTPVPGSPAKRGKKPCFDPITGLPMRPTTLAALTLLRQHDRVTTRMLLMSEAGSRFGGRLEELRKLGFKIPAWRNPDPRVSGFVYELIAEPDVRVERRDRPHDDGSISSPSSPCPVPGAVLSLSSDQEADDDQVTDGSVRMVAHDMRRDTGPRDNGQSDHPSALFDAAAFQVREMHP